MRRSTANWLLYTSLFAVYAFLVHPHFDSELMDETVDVLGLVLALVGLTIRIISRDWKLAHVSEGLVTSGPYAVVRNPMYLGSLLIGLGLCTIIGNMPFLAAYAAAFLLVHALVVRKEERILAERWPTEYAAYRLSVPAWIPSASALIREFRRGGLRPVNLRKAVGKELNSIFIVLVAGSLLEAREDYIVEGWRMAHVEVSVLLVLAAMMVAAWILCAIGQSGGHSTT